MAGLHCYLNDELLNTLFYFNIYSKRGTLFWSHLSDRFYVCVKMLEHPIMEAEIDYCSNSFV